MTWSAADDYCSGNGMKLAAISEQRDMFSLGRTLNVMDSDSYWTAGMLINFKLSILIKIKSLIM
jgi:hypothetical protein